MKVNGVIALAFIPEPMANASGTAALLELAKAARVGPHV
jgi:hypothetical protein